MGEKTLDLRREDEGREVRKVSGSSVSKNFGLLTIPFFEGNSTQLWHRFMEQNRPKVTSTTQRTQPQPFRFRLSKVPLWWWRSCLNRSP